MTCKDCQNTKEQNIRMRKWFQQRTGLKDTILNNQMKALDKILTKQ